MGINPFETLPEVPALTVTSQAVADGEALAPRQVSAMARPDDGGDALPDLAWSGAPEGTKSFAITCYDPDAPTMSGFWHFAAFNIPADTTSIPEGAVVLGDRSGFPEAATILRNDGGLQGFVGSAPPPGHGDHRYYFVVHALDVETLDIDETASPARLGFMMFGSTLARGHVMGTFGH